MFSDDPTLWPWLFVVMAVLFALLYLVRQEAGAVSPWVVYYPSNDKGRTWSEDAEERLREIVQEQQLEITELRHEVWELQQRRERGSR